MTGPVVMNCAPTSIRLRKTQLRERVLIPTSNGPASCCSARRCSTIS